MQPNDPGGIAVSGSNLFVTNQANGTIGEYTTSGAIVNAALVSGLNTQGGIAISGSDLFVTNYSSGTIGGRYVQLAVEVVAPANDCARSALDRAALARGDRSRTTGGAVHRGR